MSHRDSEQPAISLFSFLDTLVCVMGALILLLMVTAYNIPLQAVAKDKAEKAKTQKSPASGPAPLLAAESREAARAEREAAERQREELEAEARQKLAELEESRGRQLERVHEQDAVLAMANQKLKSVESGKSDLYGRLAALKQETERESKSQADAQAEQDKLTEEITHAQKMVAALKRQHAHARSQYAFIPYDGASGTTRRPIFIECTKDGLRVLPENEFLGQEELVGITEHYNPLLLGTKALIDYWKGEGELKPDKIDQKAPPYVLILVRPGGCFYYYLARRMLSHIGQPFGYELIEEDYPLYMPPPDPQAKTVLHTAIETALHNRAEAVAHLDRRGRRDKVIDLDEFNIKPEDKDPSRERRPQNSSQPPSAGMTAANSLDRGAGGSGRAARRSGNPNGGGGGPAPGAAGSPNGAFGNDGAATASNGSAGDGSIGLGSGNGGAANGGLPGGGGSTSLAGGNSPGLLGSERFDPFGAPGAGDQSGPGSGDGAAGVGSGLGGIGFASVGGTGGQAPGASGTGGGADGQDADGQGQPGNGSGGSGQLALGQSGTGQGGFGLSGTGQGGLGQGGLGQGGLGQGGTGQGGFQQGGLGQGGLGQGGLGQGGVEQSGLGEGGTGQDGLGQGGFAQSGFGRGGLGQSGLGQGRLGQSGRAGANGSGDGSQPGQGGGNGIQQQGLGLGQTGRGTAAAETEDAPYADIGSGATDGDDGTGESATENGTAGSNPQKQMPNSGTQNTPGQPGTMPPRGQSGTASNGAATPNGTMTANGTVPQGSSAPPPAEPQLEYIPRRRPARGQPGSVTQSGGASGQSGGTSGSGPATSGSTDPTDGGPGSSASSPSASSSSSSNSGDPNGDPSGSSGSSGQPQPGQTPQIGLPQVNFGNKPQAGNSSKSQGRDNLAKQRWGYSQGKATMGFERKVLLEVTAEKIRIGDGDIVIPVGQGESREQLVEQVLAGIDENAQEWGNPPDRFYWIPYIHFRVYPGGTQHYERLHSSLKKWGLFSKVEFVVGERPLKE